MHFFAFKSSFDNPMKMILCQISKESNCLLSTVRNELLKNTQNEKIQIIISILKHI